MMTHIPPGARIMITGGASGLGREAALQLAGLGHRIVILDRDAQGADAVVRTIGSGGGRAEAHRIDLGDLAGIRSFAEAELAHARPVDVLLNNAGLLPPADRAVTKNGFELAFGVSYLSHFALTGLLLPALARSPAPRVVSVSSLSHAKATLDMADLQVEHDYTWSKAYAASKLACLLFARELQRRATASGARLLSVAAHPGVSRTPIGANRGGGRRTVRDRLDMLAYHAAMRFLGRTSAEGAAPLVHAAVGAVTGGGYYGPTGLMQARGPAGAVQPGPAALDAALGTALFDRSETLSGVRFTAIP